MAIVLSDSTRDGWADALQVPRSREASAAQLVPRARGTKQGLSCVPLLAHCLARTLTAR